MLGFAGYYIATLTPTYNSRGVLYINNQPLLSSLTAIRDNNTNFWITPAQATTNEFVELMRTDAYIRAIVLQTDLEEKMSEGPETIGQAIDYVRRNVSVTPLGKNQVQVTATDPESEMAYQFVNASIQSYIQWKMNTERADSLVAQDFLGELIEEYELDLESTRKDLETYIIAHPDPVRGNRPYLETLEIERLNGNIRIAEDRYTSALLKEEDAKISLQQIESEARQTYVLIDAPRIPLEPEFSLRKIGLNAAVFLAVGLFFSAAMIVGSAILDRSIRFPADVAIYLDLPLLATIQEVKPKKISRFAHAKSKIKSRFTNPRIPDAKNVNSIATENSYRDPEQELDAAV